MRLGVVGMCVGWLVLHLLAAGSAFGQTSRPSVTGIIKAEGEVPLSEMVVYLESPDPARKVTPSTQPARISQKGAQFEPRLLVVCVGQTVEFPNDEDRLIEHNVFSNSMTKKFDLGMYGPGVSKSVVFDKAGAVTLGCTIHRYMDGVIYISPTPYTSRVDESGRYTIYDVPPGDWVVKTWQRRRRFLEQSVPVTVVMEKAVDLDLELKKR